MLHVRLRDVPPQQPRRPRRRVRAGQGTAGQELERELARRLGRGSPVVPAVFIGGSLVGGINRVMALHLAGELVPMLMNAGALWL
ncbi:hypothetical protein ACQ4PT_011894 [Festuca glaucescens]